MKARIFVVVAAVVLAIGYAQAASPLLITDRIDSQKVIDGMPIVKRDVGKSDNGRIRHRWTINGNQTGSLEIIGNNPADADLVGMRCVSYDNKGNFVPPNAPDAPCHRLFVKLLSKFTTTPEWFAKKLIEESVQSKVIEQRRLDDLSLETDGDFYFVRRLSRSR